MARPAHGTAAPFDGPFSPNDAPVSLNGTSTLLTADQVAARWQVSPAQVYRLTREGRLPTVRIGRYYRYRLAGVEDFEATGGVGTE